MNEVIEVPESQQSLKTIGHISYFMHAVVAVGAVLPGVQASVLLLLIAFFLDMFKRDDARGTVYESHFRFQTRSFWWFVLWFVVLLVPTLLTIGFVPFFVVAQVWFAYRMIKGWLRVVDRREVG